MISTRFLVAAALGLSLSVVAKPTIAAEQLPALAIDRGAISVSGLSSGGYMAHQMHVAHSALIMGAAIFAAGPYDCAGNGYPFNLWRAFTVCLDTPGALPFFGPPDPAASIKDMQEQAKEGHIDVPENLKHARIYLFSGMADPIMPTSVVASLQSVYQAFVEPANIEAVFTKNAGHGMITADYGSACSITATPFVNDCDYDAAGALLTHIYGPLTAPVSNVSAKEPTAFDQKEFTVDGDRSLSTDGHIYIPQSCMTEPGCRLHIAFHGCLQQAVQIGDAFYGHAGYNRWAEANRIVVLYPEAAVVTRSVAGITIPWPNPQGCWDWWGFTGPGYDTKSGSQVAAVTRMIDRLSESR